MVRKQKFNTLIRIKKIVDERGEVIKIMSANKIGWPAKDVIVASIQSGAIRGNHYHKKKEEIYVVISGKVRATLLDLKTGKRKILMFDGKKRKMLIIPPYIAHSVKNVGKETAWFIEVQNTDYTPRDDFKYEP